MGTIIITCSCLGIAAWCAAPRAAWCAAASACLCFRAKSSDFFLLSSNSRCNSLRSFLIRPFCACNLSKTHIVMAIRSARFVGQPVRPMVFRKPRVDLRSSNSAPLPLLPLPRSSAVSAARSSCSILRKRAVREANCAFTSDRRCFSRVRLRSDRAWARASGLTPSSELASASSDAAATAAARAFPADGAGAVSVELSDISAAPAECSLAVTTSSTLDAAVATGGPESGVSSVVLAAASGRGTSFAATTAAVAGVVCEVPVGGAAATAPGAAAAAAT
mmetsp:Transcript_34922/g.64338  ORF Transcript_34922/g.64338 Transcript_34922/m.64338 type:complete len:277 (+) Transcript_34922:475-1305(+)